MKVLIDRAVFNWLPLNLNQTNNAYQVFASSLANEDSK